MATPLRTLAPVIFAAGGLGGACGSSSPDEPPARIQARAERQSDGAMSPNELSEARRRAGFESATELEEQERRRIVAAAEAYVTARLDQYVGILDAIEADLAELERGAPKLVTETALGKFQRTRERARAKLEVSFAELDRRGPEGGALHAAAKAVYERWQDLTRAVEPGVATDPRFAEELAGIAEALADVRASLAVLDTSDERTQATGASSRGRAPARRDELR